MNKHGKKYTDLVKKIEKDTYELPEAVSWLKENVKSGFDQTVEIHFNLGVDPKHADQVVRGNVVLPHGTGKKVRVLVFAKAALADAAKEAGADHVGGDELVAKIQEGWTDFDKVVASPDMMPVVGKVARVLGPRGLMPNPKTGTVTPDVAKAVKELQAGKVSYRVDKGSNVHASVGKLSFSQENLVDNTKALIESVVKAKPATAKGEYVKGIYLTSTMSPSLALSKAIVR
jgi:large subunit ribosomal protein L1